MASSFGVRAARLGGLCLAAICIAIVTSGCLMLNKDNRRLMNKLDEVIQPESTAARVGLAPVGIALGLGSLAADQAIVHPANMLPVARDDAKKSLWSSAETDSLSGAILMPLRVAATPPYFAFDWVMRSLIVGGE